MHPIVRFAGKVVPGTLKQQLKEDLTRYFQAPSIELTLKNMRQLGFTPATIIDIGAHIGQWSLMVHEIFPQATVLMLEAQTSKASTLETIANAHPGKIRYRIAVLGPEPREDVVFHECDAAPTASSVLSSHEPLAFQDVRRRMETLDNVLQELALTQPDLLKLDIQGYELEALKGGSQALRSAHAVLLEVSTVELYKGAPLLQDVVAFMDQHGFRAYDICNLMRLRSSDTLVQLDMIFVKADSFLFTKVAGQL